MMLKQAKRPIDLRQMNPTHKKAKRDRKVITGRIYLPPEMWSWIRCRAEDTNSSDGEIIEFIVRKFRDDEST